MLITTKHLLEVTNGDSLHSTMNQHVKGKHLSFEEWVIIQTRLKDGCSIRAIARELGCCSPSTISYEV
ncbi:helix-turn-helix domain-containing protein, partial [Lactobacillus helveticus]|uniref:helix-turn-helix domain-containing protein n=1 Tax=Lactobacillus helveticus TaxID=1587 RepID=UPI0021821FBA